MCGGIGAPQPVSDDVRAILLSVKPQILQQAGLASTHAVFEPQSARTQVVAGMNIFAKIHVGDDKYVHATVWHKPDQSKEVTKVEKDKSATDAL